MKAEAAPVQGGWKRAAAVYLALILLVRLALHLFLFRALDGNLPTGPDEAERIWHAWHWSRSPAFSAHHAWLPLPFWLLGSCMWLIPDPVRASVVCCVILGLACLYLLWRIGSRLFPEDPLAALLPAAVVAGSASQVWVAATPTTGIILLFMVLAGIHSALLWEESGSAFHKWLAMAFFSLSAWTRYEGLLFCGAFAFWMAAAHRDWSGIAVFACPFIWGAWGFLRGGGALERGLLMGLARGEGNAFIFPDWEKLETALRYLFLRPPFAGQALCLFGLLSSFPGRRREAAGERLLIFAGFLPLAAFVLLGFLAGIVMYSYHSSPFEALLSLLWGAVSQQAWRGWGERRKHAVFILVMALVSGHALLRGIPSAESEFNRDPVSRRVGIALKLWTRDLFSGRDSLLLELPKREGNLSKYVWMWKAYLAPCDLHMDRGNLYVWEESGARLIEENNPSLFQRPEAGLTGWMEEHGVRGVVVQDRLGRKAMEGMAGWERAGGLGRYEIYLRKGDPAGGRLPDYLEGSP